MIPLPLPMLLKYGGIAAFVIAVYAFGHHKGANAIRADWGASKAKILAEQQGLLLSHMEEADGVRKAQEETNIKVAEDHERALNAVKEKYDADLLAVRRAGGLRVSRSICDSPVAAASETTSTKRIDEATTVRLPIEIEDDLFALAKTADEAGIRCTALQQWVVDSGFYKKAER